MKQFQAYGDNRYIIISKRVLLAQIFALLKACEAVTPTPLDANDVSARYTAQAIEQVDKLSEEEVDTLLNVAIEETTEIRHNLIPSERFYANAFNIALQWLAGIQSNLSFRELEEEITAKVHKCYKQYLAVKSLESTKVEGVKHEITG